METRKKPSVVDVGAQPDAAAGPHNDPDRIRNDMKQASDSIREQARATGEQLKGSASEAGRQAKEMAGQAAEQTKRKASEYARQAQSHGREMFDQQKTRAVEQVQTLGQAVRRAADKFREEHDDNIAGYIDAAADEVQRLGNYLERRDLNSLWRDAQSFGRRRPEWFLGGMFVAGLALTRFLKASADRSESHRMRDYGGYAGESFGGQPDIGHQLPDPARATHEFAGTPGAGSTGAMSGSPGDASSMGAMGAAGSSSPATDLPATNPGGPETGATGSIGASINPSPDKPWTQPEVQ